MTELSYTGPFSKKAAFTQPITHPLLLDLILIKAFGAEYLTWEPETLWKEIELTFGVTTSEVNKNKIQAVKTCHVVDRPYEAWEVFEKVATSLGGAIPKFDVIQKPSPHLCASAVENMQHVRDKKFSDEVYKYIAAVLLDDGISYAHGPLEPCNKHMLLYVDPVLQKRVKQAIEKGRIPTFDGNNDEDVQVAKVLSIKDYVEFESRRLLRQMNVVMKKG